MSCHTNNIYTTTLILITYNDVDVSDNLKLWYNLLQHTKLLMVTKGIKRNTSSNNLQQY